MAEQFAFSGDLLHLLQRSARSGTLLSSCDLEVHELMHQLDVHITSRCKQWEVEVTRLTAELLNSQQQTDRLSTVISVKTAEMDKFEKRAHSKEREYQACIADNEAQLLRLSSEVSRITLNYKELRKKRYHHPGARDTSCCSSDAATQTQVKPLEGELDRRNMQMYRTAEKPRKQDAQLTQLQAGSLLSVGNKEIEHVHTLTQASAEKWAEEPGKGQPTKKTLEEFAEGLDNVLGGERVHLCQLLQRTSMGQDVGQEQSSPASVHATTTQLVDNLLNKHIKQLNHDLLEVLESH